MLLLLGVVFAVIAGFLSDFILKLNFINSSSLGSLGAYGNLIMQYQNFIISSLVYSIFIILYYFLVKKLSSKNGNFQAEEKNLIHMIDSRTISDTNFISLKDLSETLKSFIEEFNESNELAENLRKKNKDLQYKMDNSNVLFFVVNEKWSVSYLNETSKESFGVPSSFEFNKKFNSLKSIIKEEIEDIDDVLDREKEVEILGKHYLMLIKYIKENKNYLVRMVDITKYKLENEKLKDESGRVREDNPYLYNDEAMEDKYSKTTCIKILNYDKYATYLDNAVLKRFEESFIKILVKNGYERIYKVSRDIYAVNGYVNDINLLKGELEVEIVIKINNDNNFILRPIVILGAGANYEKAKQQVLESSVTLKSAIKSDKPKYPFAYLNKVNEYILDNNIHFTYQQVGDMILVEPLIKLDNSAKNIAMVSEYLKEFNLYIPLLHKVLVKYLNILEKQKLIINLDSTDLVDANSFIALLKFARNNQLDVTFNININGYYEFTRNLLRDIKTYAKISLKNIGHSYFDIELLYDLKVNYMELDESVIEHIKQNPQAKNFVSGLKVMIKDEKTRLMASGFNDESILEFKAKKSI